MKPTEARTLIERWFTAGLEAVDPYRCVTDVLRSHTDLPPKEGRLVVIAIGKAAPAMAAAAADVLEDRIDYGLVVTKHGHLDGVVRGFDCRESSHPIPDLRSLDAGVAVMDAVRDLSPADTVLALISGGASSLVEVLRDGVSLEDLRDVSDRMMRAGAGIHDLNAVRQRMSAFKGGGLRTAIGPARCVTFLLSDVLGNDPSIIASGPTVAPAHRRDAEAILRQFGLDDVKLPDVQPCAIDTSADVVRVIADNQQLVADIGRQARAAGLRPAFAWRAFDGDAEVLGRTIPDVSLQHRNANVLIGGGEATVRVRGGGVGGRNTHASLVAAWTIRDGAWVFASLASDGDDGSSNAAGAVVGPETWQSLWMEGLDPEDSLRRSDSATALSTIHALVRPGPTGTNVNDVYIAIRID